MLKSLGLKMPDYEHDRRYADVHGIIGIGLRSTLEPAGRIMLRVLLAKPNGTKLES
jgi:hypothetical protein